MDTQERNMGLREKLAAFKRYQLALILFVVLMIAYIDRVNISVLVVDPIFLQDMGIASDPFAKGSLMTVFLLFFGGGMIVFSPIGDKLGPRKTMLIAVTIMALSMLFGGLAGSFVMMLVTRALLGIGEGFHYPMQSAFVKNWFPPNERGKANAIWLLGVNVAPMLAMPLFVWMVPAFGWRESFFFLAALGIVPFWLIWRYTADRPRLLTGITAQETAYIERALADETKADEAAASGNVWQNMLGVLKNDRVWLLTVIYTGASSIYWGVVTWLPSYLKDARGFSWNEMGILASLPFILSIVVKVIAGHASDKLGHPARFVLGGLFASASFIYLGAYVESNLAAAFFIACGTSGIAIVSPCSWVLLQAVVPSRAVGAAAGFMSGASSLISAAAPLMVGWAIALTGSYIGGLMYMVAWGGIGVLAALWLMQDKRC